MKKRAWVKHLRLGVLALFWTCQVQAEDPQIPVVSMLELPKVHVEINIPATRLKIFKDDQLIKTYRIAVGSPRWPSPVRDFSFQQIIWNPGWFPPTTSEWAKNSKPIPPGPGNPLGPVKLPMQEAILIHGTSKPWSIGHAGSHGCFRMKSQDAIELGSFFQSELLPNDPQNWDDTYKKERWKTVWKNLPVKVPVKVKYDPIEFVENQVLLHPNYYGRRVSYQKKIVDYLLENEVYSAPIDPKKIETLSKLAWKNPGIVSLEELLFEEESELPNHELFDQACKIPQTKKPHPTKHLGQFAQFN